MADLDQVVQRNNARRQQGRREASAFADLIATPHDFGTIDGTGSQHPLTLPANGRLAFSSSNTLSPGDVTVTVGPVRGFTNPALTAGDIFKGEYGEATQAVDVKSSADLGTFSLYFIDAFGNSFTIGQSGGGGAHMPASTVVFDLDSTQSASYDNVTALTTWKNLIAAPADGSAQTDYDFDLDMDGGGAGSPVFVGTAGTSSGAFDALAQPPNVEDGFVEGQDKLNVLTSFEKSMPRTDKPDFWFAIAFKVGLTKRLFMIQTSGIDASPDENGVDLSIHTGPSPDGIYFTQITAGVANGIKLVADSALVVGTPYLLIIQSDKQNNKIKFALNASVFTELAYTWTTNTDDQYNWNGSRYSAMDVGSEWKAQAMGNGAMSDSDLVALHSLYALRHGVSY